MVDVKLVSYIKEGLEKGYSKDDLLKLLVENGWNKQEVTLAIKFIEKEKEKKVIKKPKPKPEQPILKQFIKESLDKGASETEIKNVLLSKGWKSEIIDSVFEGIEKPIKIKEEPKIEQREEPRKEKKEVKIKKVGEKKFSPMKLLTYAISFIFITLILSGTFVVYFYIQGMNDYTITDSSGEQLRKTCINEDCSDLKEYALENVKDKLTIAVLISAGVAIVALLLHFMLPFKTQMLWVFNILYFLFLGLILFFWIKFQNS
jgi:hypothetical protein